MKILISAVGTTDPITKNHDGALLHLSRIYRPDRVVLIYSEEMLVKKDRIQAALQSIDGYNPEILIDPTILKNDEVYVFDKMYAEITQIIERYLSDEDELILNLSSATPQIISAMFAVNRINNYNIRAVQVATPEKSANRPFNPAAELPIEELIDGNKDNQEDFENRSLEDQSEKFNQSLVKRYLRQLIKHYDYAAALAILQEKNNKILSKSQRAKACNILNNVTDVFEKQAILQDLAREEDRQEAVKALNYYLMIDILNRRGQIADVLIKAKSLVEYILEEKIQSEHPGLIVRKENLPKLNLSHPDADAIIDYLEHEMKKERGSESKERVYNKTSTLNLLSFSNILEFYQAEESLLESIKLVKSFNGERNRLAHGLAEIDKKAISSKRLRALLGTLKDVLQSNYDIREERFSYYDVKNEELLELLK